MTFSVPQMPLTMRWHRAAPLVNPVPPDGWFVGPCALRDTLIGDQLSSSPFAASHVLVLVPAGTDIRAGPDADRGDLVEVPAGSGLYHICVAVIDRWKGFTNEHRVGVLEQLNTTLGQAGGPWWVYPQP